MDKLRELNLRWKLLKRLEGCLINILRIIFTFFLLGLIVAYSLSFIRLDFNIILMIFIILLVWFAPVVAKYFENIELSREGDKWAISVTMAKLLGIQEEAEEANLFITPEKTSDIEKFVALAEISPNSALIALRTDIEKRLRELVAVSGIDSDTLGRGRRMLSVLQMTENLKKEGMLTEMEAKILNELRSTLNSVAHAADVSDDVTQWAVSTGPFILAALDKKISELKSK